MLMKTQKGYHRYIVLLDPHMTADLAKRYGTCVAHIGSEQKVLAVVLQTRSTGDRPTIEEEFSNGTLLNFSKLSQDPWQNILNNTDITFSKVIDLLRGHT
ncbi:hypothetical protein Aduo_009570 [Ancylostoma duodenale]